MPVVTSVAVRRGGTDDLMRRLDEMAAATPTHSGATRLAGADRVRSARRPARGRPADQGRRAHAGQAGHADHAARRGAAASGGRPRHSAGDPVRDVPGGVHLGAAADGSDLRRLRCARRRGARCVAGRPAAELPPGRRDLRRRQRDRLPAADPDPVPVHPAAGRSRLHGARRVPDGPHHGRRRPARPRLHSAAVELRLRHPRHHGDAGDRQPARPADHHPGGAADDLLGAHSGLHADHLGLHSGQARLGLRQPAGAGDVRPLCRRHRQRARRVVRRQVLLLARQPDAAVHARIARLQTAAAAQRRHGPLHAGEDVPPARRHHDLLHDGADLVPGLVPASAGGRERAGDQLQPRRHASATRSSRCWRRSASTGRSTSP